MNMGIETLLLGNLVLALAVASATVHRLRCADPSQRRLLWTLLVVAGLFIPLLGAPGLAWALLSGVRNADNGGTARYRPLGSAQFDAHQREEGSHFDRGGLRARVSKPEVPSAMRLQSLAALQHLPAVAASPVLRTLLDDDVEDIRLVAFGMLDREEKAITGQIHRLLQRPEPAAGAARLQHHKRLAELYWELAYSGLVQGDLRRYTLEHALEHAQTALTQQADEAGLCFLAGRILYALGKTDAAEERLLLATALGIPEPRILPYLAEFAFHRGDFAHTRQLLAALGDTPVTPRLRPVLDFWQGGRVPC